MWDSKNNYDYLGILSEKIRILEQKTCKKYKLPKKGLVLLFDDSDYENIPDDSIWRNLGNHLNIEAGDGLGSENPTTLKKIIKSKDYSHLIWLAKRTWSITEIDLVWNLSHELRHLEQDIENHYLSLAGNFLYSNLGGMKIDETKIQTTVPTEMDSELSAWRTVKNLFGQQLANSYVHENANAGKKKEIFLDLLKHGLDKKYETIYETIRLLKKYKNQFDEILNQAPSYYKKLGSVDELCRNLNISKKVN